MYTTAAGTGIRGRAVRLTLADLVVAEYRAARTQKLRADPGMNARPTPRG